MVVRRTINNLRERPKEDRRAVASSIAIALVVVLFLGWVLIFFRAASRTASQLDYSAIPKPDLSSLPQASFTEPANSTTEQGQY